MRYTVLILAMLATMIPHAFASDIQSGLWEITMDTRVPATPDFPPSVNTLNQCMTEQDARDPSRVLGGAANPGASDCVYTEKNFVGSTFRFKMQCAGSFGIQTRGEVNYSATSMTGTIISTANVLGQATEFHSSIAARRLGECHP